MQVTDCSWTHLEANSEALGAVDALLAVFQVGVEPLGLVTFPPCHVVPGEESACLLDGHHRQVRLVVFVCLKRRGREGSGQLWERKGEGRGEEERGGEGRGGEGRGRERRGEEGRGGEGSRQLEESGGEEKGEEGRGGDEREGEGREERGRTSHYKNVVYSPNCGTFGNKSRNTLPTQIQRQQSVMCRLFRKRHTIFSILF